MSPKRLEDMYDAVIVGAGAAGLSAALGLLRSPRSPSSRNKAWTRRSSWSPNCSRCVRTPVQPRAASPRASGNVESDDWHWHYYDTIKGGDWLVDQMRPNCSPNTRRRP